MLVDTLIYIHTKLWLYVSVVSIYQKINRIYSADTFIWSSHGGWGVYTVVWVYKFYTTRNSTTSTRFDFAHEWRGNKAPLIFPTASWFVAILIMDFHYLYSWSLGIALMIYSFLVLIRAIKWCKFSLVPILKAILSY